MRQLIEAALQHWPGAWNDLSGAGAVHEAGRLHLQIDKASHQLGWQLAEVLQYLSMYILSGLY